MKSLSAYPSEQQPLGFFRIFAQPLGGTEREITLFRSVPVKLGTVTTQDPFTDATAQISLPQVTVFDCLGEGDLDWLVPNCSIDIVWENVGDYEYEWRWEGYIASYNFGLTGADSSFTVDLKGAFYGLDDFLAKPGFPKRPIPYEILIAQAFDQNAHPSNLGRFQILFPPWWNLKVPEFNDPKYLSALKPWGVRAGQLWTGYTARNTGSWEPVLTGFVQSRLTEMLTEGGSQWSIRNLGHRRPELFLRQVPRSDSESIIEIELGAPGISLDGSRDYTQRAGIMYGAGVDEAGISFSNIQVTPDGKTTYFKPFAYSPRMYPTKKRANPSYDPTVKPKETLLRFQDGVDEVSATKMAQGQFQRFYEPGITGSITLTTDPRTAAGELVPRLLIKGGQTIRIKGLLGVREGVLAHVTECTADLNALTTTLTFDTKYRDQLTVEEVRARTRDALTPMRKLQVGKYSNTIQDLVLPWSTKAGSGIIPTAAKDAFAQMPDNATFPFEEFTRNHPPSDPHYAPWYIKIDKTDPDNSNNNWATVKRDKAGVAVATMSIPIRMGQAGSIRLSQIAAYDKHGNVMKVKFHVSVYKGDALPVDSMPAFPGKRRMENPKKGEPGEPDTIPDPDFPKYLDARKPNGDVIPTSYETDFKMEDTDDDPDTDKVKVWHKMHHPFYEGAWEVVQPDGTQYNVKWGGDVQMPQELPQVGWGNYFEPAGYSPGRFSKGASRTGLLEDTTAWQWDLNDVLELTMPQENWKEEYSGMLFILIYCDDQGDEPVYFMGRFVRAETGTS